MEQLTCQWQIIGQSVRGAAHERRGVPNQDAIGWWPKTGAGSVLVVAVSDGHGSPRYSRSHVGARLAVQTSTRLIHRFATRHKGARNLSITKRTAEEWLPQALSRAWLEAVKRHLDRNPLTDDDAVNNENDPENQATAYGTTLLAAAVANQFVIYLQIGDGDILTVSDDGEVGRPLPQDERLLANETTSLCAVDAWRDFRVGFQPIASKRPALILLATDGYSNSFRDDTGFKQAGVDLLRMIRTDGMTVVRNSLEGWLLDTTRIGSGDDVTLGILSPIKAGPPQNTRRK